MFETSLGGQLTTLYSFYAQANCADGKHPSAGLIQASHEEYGTIFRITPGGTLTTL